MHDQADAQLVQFAATLYFDNGQSVEITSEKDFEHYAEVRPLRTNSVSITWIYLLNFRGIQAPAKQQIDVTFLANKLNWSDYDDDERTVTVMRGFRYEERSAVSIRINHTMRSWGMDLEALISDHVGVFLADKKERYSKVYGRLVKDFRGALLLLVQYRLRRHSAPGVCDTLRGNMLSVVFRVMEQAMNC